MSEECPNCEEVVEMVDSPNLTVPPSYDVLCPKCRFVIDTKNGSALKVTA